MLNAIDNLLGEHRAERHMMLSHAILHVIVTMGTVTFNGIDVFWLCANYFVSHKVSCQCFQSCVYNVLDQPVQPD